MLDVTALILAGGRASRLGGVAKHALVVDGEPILARQLRVLAPRCAEVIVALAPGAPAIAGVTCVHDQVMHAGPLAGIDAGLRAARTPWCLVVACDMPDITGALVDRILTARAEGVDTHSAPPFGGAARSGKGGPIDAVGVRAGGRVEPLVGALRVAAALQRVAQLVADGEHKASRLWDAALHIAWIDDADPRALRNVNSPTDLR